MANDVISEYFSRLEVEICSKFDILINLLGERKNIILRELHTMRKEFNEKHQTFFDKLKGLEESILELQLVSKSLKGNQAVQQMNNSISELDKERMDLKSQLSKPKTVFLCDITILRDIINNDVILLDEPPTKLTKPFPPRIVSRPISAPRKSRFSSDLRPLGSEISKVTRFRPKNGIKTSQNGIYIHSESNSVFICDNTEKVQIWSLEGEYLSEFGKGVLKNSYGVVRLNEFIFVTDMGKSCIFKFAIPDFYLITSSIQVSPEYSNIPDHICCDGREIFVAHEVPSIAVFTSNLKLVRTLKTREMYFTTGIVVQKGKLFVLELKDNIIHVLNSENGTLLSQIQTNKGSANFSKANNFCMDNACNFLITDLESHLIKKIDKNGSHIKTFDTSVMECFQPNAIAVTDTNKVVVAFRSGEWTHFLIDSF